MKLVFEVSNEKKFREHYAGSLREIENKIPEVKVSEDSVSYGDIIPDEIIVGIVFILQNVLTDVMWNSIKNTVKIILKTMNSRKKDKIFIEVEEENGRRHSISVISESPIKIEIPNTLRFHKK